VAVGVSTRDAGGRSPAGWRRGWRLRSPLLSRRHRYRDDRRTVGVIVPAIAPDVPVDPMTVRAPHPPRSGSINGFVHSLTCRRDSSAAPAARSVPSSHMVAPFRGAIVSTIAGITRRRRSRAGVSGDTPKGRRSVRETS
jgi:hypothetical protein